MCINTCILSIIHVVLPWLSLWLADCFSIYSMHYLVSWFTLKNLIKTFGVWLAGRWTRPILAGFTSCKGHLVVCAWREENDAPCFLQVDQKPRVCFGFLHRCSCEKHMVRVISSRANSNASDVKSMLQRTSQERPSLIGQTSLGLEIYLVYNLWPGTLHRSWHATSMQIQRTGQLHNQVTSDDTLKSTFNSELFPLHHPPPKHPG